MMKKLSAVAIAVLIASQANATEVFSNEKVNLDISARAYAGEIIGTKDNGTEKSEANGGNNYIRLGAKGESVVSGTTKAVGAYEAQFKSQNTEKEESLDNLTTRLAYGGIKDENFGTMTFGRQLGAVGTIAAWTDVGLTDGYGNDGLGVKADQYGTYRSNDVLKYTKTINNFQVDADYKFSTATVDASSAAATATSETAANMGAMGVAVSYNLPNSFSVGTGYNVAQRDYLNRDDAQLWIIGAKFDNKTWYAALNFDKGNNYYYTTTNASGKAVDMTGMEAVLGYNFANGFGLQAMYNKQKQDVDGGTSVNAVDYYTAGVVYKFNKNFRVMAEYRINNKDNGVNAKATSYSATTANGYDYKNDLQLAARYDF